MAELIQILFLALGVLGFVFFLLWSGNYSDRKMKEGWIEENLGFKIFLEKPIFGKYVKCKYIEYMDLSPIIKNPRTEYIRTEYIGIFFIKRANINEILETKVSKISNRRYYEFEILEII